VHVREGSAAERRPLRHLVLRGCSCDGTEAVVRRGRRAEDVRFVVPPQALVRPEWTLEAAGWGEDRRGLLGGISRG
jgi:hypothetical protein